MTSWKTTLGGALAALGTFLWGAPVAMKAMEVPVEPALIKWCVIAGLIASAAGVFFIGLFGRDNNVTSEDVQRAAEEKKRNGGLNLFVVFLIGLMALGLLACKTPKLEPGGAYAPTNAVGQVVVNDLGLAVADATYKFTYEATLSVFEFERANRTNLWAIEPGIKRELDRLRPKVQDIDRRWATARKEYREHPTPAGLSTVKTILAELQRLLPVLQTQLTLATAKLGQPQN